MSDLNLEEFLLINIRAIRFYPFLPRLECSYSTGREVRNFDTTKSSKAFSTAIEPLKPCFNRITPCSKTSKTQESELIRKKRIIMKERE